MDEPMDVDLSSRSTSAMDISYTGSSIDLSVLKSEQPDIYVIENYFDLKAEPISQFLVCNNISISKTSASNNNVKNRSVLFVSTIFFLIGILTFQIANFNCCGNLSIEMINHNLGEKLHGQSAAVQNIITALESKKTKKILILYGGTGVGKTFTTSIIFENLLEMKNIYHYTMPGFLQTFSSELMLGLLFCKTATIIVDDLNRNDILSIKEPIRNLITKSEKLAKNITIILIYNCEMVDENFLRKCDSFFIKELSQSLTDIDAHKHFIKYEPLTETHLQQCIKDELLDKNINFEDMDKILKQFNVTLDGCKGVHQKLKYLSIL